MKSNSLTALDWLPESAITSLTESIETVVADIGAARSEWECAAEDRSSGIVWQSCCEVCDPERSVDFSTGLLHRRVSQQCPLLPGNIKNCSHETHPPHR